MDNAIASKQALNLSVGITLTSEQVAALTHDIVWLEKMAAAPAAAADAVSASAGGDCGVVSAVPGLTEGRANGA